MPTPHDDDRSMTRLIGKAVERVEDAALLTGRGRFADDMGERPGTAHAAVLRSPYAHAEIVSVDATDALSMPDVVTVLTGVDVAAWSRAFLSGVKTPMRHYALAVDRVRYPSSATRRQNACNVLICGSRKPKVGTTRHRAGERGRGAQTQIRGGGWAGKFSSSC